MTEVRVTSELKNGTVWVYSEGYVHKIHEYLEIQKKYYEELLRYKVKRAIVDITRLRFPEKVFDQMQIVNFVNDDPYFKNARSFRIAVLFGDHDTKMAKFWEAYSGNRGFTFKGFTSREDALKWITG